MSETGPLVRNVSDTALWVAVYRARETERLKFGPPEGSGFFVPLGWRPVDVRSPLKTAARLKRLGFGMRILARLPESSGPQGSRPWSGVCLFERA